MHSKTEKPLSAGNFFMLWGRPNLGAKKAREKRGENSPLMHIHLNSIIDGQKQKYCPCPNKRQRSAAMVRDYQQHKARKA